MQPVWQRARRRGGRCDGRGAENQRDAPNARVSAFLPPFLYLFLLRLSLRDCRSLNFIQRTALVRTPLATRVRSRLERRSTTTRLSSCLSECPCSRNPTLFSHSLLRCPWPNSKFCNTLISPTAQHCCQRHLLRGRCCDRTDAPVQQDTQNA